MIASLRGKVQSTSLNSVVLEISGVGYLVSVIPSLSLSTNIGDHLYLETAFVVREDAFTIYGFETSEELTVFDLLRSVTGVGPKSALSIINQLGVEALSNAVANDDDSAFKVVSGIGPKTAKLIVLTLAGKLVGTSGGSRLVTGEEVLSALVGLGYAKKFAEEAVKKAASDNPGAGNELLLKSALSNLVSR